MNDTRLLFLHKQHYLDNYINPLTDQISCLGYYDGLSVIDITPKEHENSLEKTWLHTATQIEKLPGGYSEQSICLFRPCALSADSDVLTFWEMQNHSPFFAVGFIKMENPDKYLELAEKIDHFFKKSKPDPARKTYAISYLTFDNADLIVLLAGNSICYIETLLMQFENMHEIKYLHSIFGIKEQYLAICQDSHEIVPEYENTCCHIDETLFKLELNIATDGSTECLEALKAKLPSSIKDSNVEFSYMFGHGNAFISLNNITVKCLIHMLLPNGVLTHQNGIYGNGLYNIESRLYASRQSWNAIQSNLSSPPVSPAPSRSSWCTTKIKEYNLIVNRMKWAQKDLGIYSLYQSLILTLNILDQFERFKMSQDIFALTAPSLSIFDSKAKSIFSDTNLLADSAKKEAFREGILLYLDSVNSLICHTIHTGQVYLMIPGYSGTSFSIPVKLMLFYLWFMYKVKDILNDTDRQYSYILSPVMESRPITREITMGEREPDNRLIYICVSQRHLYWPQNLMVILCHEIAHYIGSSYRCRELRFECICRTLCYVIAEGICPIDTTLSHISLSEKELFLCYIKSMQKELHRHIKNCLDIAVSQTLSTCRFHSKDIREYLPNIVTKIMLGVDYGSLLNKLIYQIPPDVELRLSREPAYSSSYANKMRIIYAFQKEMDTNRLRILASNTVNQIINRMVHMYGEIFSDTAAITLLQCDWKTYCDSFAISEGLQRNATIHNNSMNFRKKIINTLFFNAEYPTSENNGIPVTNPDSMLPAEQLIFSQLFYFKSTLNYALKYATKCKETLATAIQGKERETQELHHNFEIFTSNKSCADIYDSITECIRQYKVFTYEQLNEQS